MLMLCSPAHAEELRFLHSDAEALMQDAWVAFKTQYAKSYSGSKEEHLRKQIFYETLKKIENHNYLFEVGLSSYQMGINQFADMESSEVMQLNGFRRGSASDYLLTEKLSFNNNEKALDQVDWRSKGYVTEVKNQGKCGSCWSFSATGALEGQTKNKTGKLVSLSEQNLVDCSQAEGNNGCSGGNPLSGFQYIYDNGGIDTEAAYPYEARDGTCRYDAKNRGATVRGVRTIPQGDESILAMAISVVGPISVAIDATDNFISYKTGILNDPLCSNRTANHAVLVAGYGSDSTGDYYIIKNSWGTTWGMNGYVLLARNKGNMCGIANFPIWPLV